MKDYVGIGASCVVVKLWARYVYVAILECVRLVESKRQLSCGQMHTFLDLDRRSHDRPVSFLCDAPILLPFFVYVDSDVKIKVAYNNNKKQ